MDESSTASSEDLADRSVRYTREQFAALLTPPEDDVRENPGRSLFYALVAGLILERLPVGRIFSGIFRLSLFAIKPAILIYGATKLYQAAQEEE
jgi:hypothetical protein